MIKAIDSGGALHAKGSANKNPAVGGDILITSEQLILSLTLGNLTRFMGAPTLISLLHCELFL